MFDWGTLAATGGFLATLGAVIYSAGRLNGKFDAHTTHINHRLDQQDDKLDETVTTLTGVQIEMGHIKGKIGMNGY